MEDDTEKRYVDRAGEVYELVEVKYRGGEEVKGIDYVTLVALPCLAIIAVVALIYGHDVHAGTAIGAIAGWVFRLNR